MECKIKDRHKLISDYLMGELPDDNAKVFEEHYFQCETCFKELKIAEDAINIIAKEGKAILNSGKSYENRNSKNIFHKIIFPDLSVPKRWGIAFGTLTVIAIILFITFRNDQKVLDEKIISKDEESFTQDRPLVKDTINDKNNSQTKNDFAELTGPSFKTVPYLEEWITENVRSQNDIIDTVFSPEIGEKFYNRMVTFQWKINNASVGITIKIMNNLEKEIYTSTLDSQSFEFAIQADPEIFKQPGLYYWRLEDENEVLYVGKFYFLKQ